MFVKLRPYLQKTLARRANEKLSPRFYEPFQITAKVGQVSCCLQLPEDIHIHPVFHVSLLKCTVGSSLPLSPLPQLTTDLHMTVEPEAVLGIRPSLSPTHPAAEVLIKWKNLPEHEASWPLL